MTSSPTIKLRGSNTKSFYRNARPVTAEACSAELGRSNVISFPEPEPEKGARKEAHHHSTGRLRSWNDPIHEVLQAYRESRGERWWL